MMLLMSYQCIENKYCAVIGSVRLARWGHLTQSSHEYIKTDPPLVSYFLVTSLRRNSYGSVQCFSHKLGMLLCARSNTIHPNALQQPVTALVCSQGARILIKNLSCTQSNLSLSTYCSHHVQTNTSCWTWAQKSLLYSSIQEAHQWTALRDQKSPISFSSTQEVYIWGRQWEQEQASLLYTKGNRWRSQSCCFSWSTIRQERVLHWAPYHSIGKSYHWSWR